MFSFDPLNRPIRSEYLILKGNNTAVIEMAKCSGIQLLKPEELNPFITSTYGTGLLIKDALNKNCNNIIIGVGGSATNDYGIGLLSALGAEFYSAKKKIDKPVCKNLSEIDDFNLELLKYNTSKVKFDVITDVENTVIGKAGATYTYGAQKGGSEKDLIIIEEKMKKFTDLIEDKFSNKISDVARTGAGGGISAGLFAFLGANLLSGSEYIAELLSIEEKIKNTDLVITGEGKIDDQSSYGKGPYYIAKLAKKYNKKVIAFTGENSSTFDNRNLFNDIIEINDKSNTLEYSLKNSAALLKKAVTNYFMNGKF